MRSPLWFVAAAVIAIGGIVGAVQYLMPRIGSIDQRLMTAPMPGSTVLTLKEADCRWPIGDPQHSDFHFCGHTKHAGLPYCEFHARKAYQPPQSMRRRDRDANEYTIVPVRKISAA